MRPTQGAGNVRYLVISNVWGTTTALQLTSRPAGEYCALCVQGVKGSILRSFSISLKMFRYGYLQGKAVSRGAVGTIETGLSFTLPTVFALMPA